MLQNLKAAVKIWEKFSFKMLEDKLSFDTSVTLILISNLKLSMSAWQHQMDVRTLAHSAQLCAGTTCAFWRYSHLYRVQIWLGNIASYASLNSNISSNKFSS